MKKNEIENEIEIRYVLKKKKSQLKKSRKNIRNNFCSSAKRILKCILTYIRHVNSCKET